MTLSPEFALPVLTLFISSIYGISGYILSIFAESPIFFPA